VISGLESAELKLVRAAEHIDAVNDAVWEYLRTEPGGISLEPHGKPQLHFTKPPDSDISVFAGEALYQMRSALDHLAFDLVKHNASGIQLPSGWEKRCEFPLLTEVPTKGNPPVPHNLPLPYNYFINTLPGISQASFTFIESLQPYNGGDGPAQLRTLAILSNIDKHRYLHPTKGEAQVRFDAVVNGYHSTAIIRKEDGAEIEAPFPEGVKMTGGFSPFVTLDESALGNHPTRLPAHDMLKFCLDGIERLVIPAFREFLKNS